MSNSQPDTPPSSNHRVDQGLRSKIGGFLLEPDTADGGDTLAIALCSYFERHMNRPRPDPDTENGWGQWAEAKTNAALDALTEALMPQDETTAGEVTVVTNESGECVAVTRTDSEHRILNVIWERSRSLAEDAHTVGRQQPSKLHDAGSNPAGGAIKPCPGHLWTDRPVCFHCLEQMPGEDSPEEPTAEWDPSTIAEKPHPVGCQCGWCAITKRASEEVGLPLLMPKEPAAAPDLCPKCGQEMFWHGYIYYGHRWDDGPRTPDEIICPKPTPQNRSANEAGPLPESLQRLAGWESAPAHESDSSVFVNAAAGNFALTPEATETEMPTPDWTKSGEHVCINHNGYTGPSADCPSCTAEKH